MVAFSTLFVAFAAIAPSFAAPTGSVEVERDAEISERGPHDFSLGSDNALERRSAINYNQDYTTSGGSVSYNPSSTGFSVDWSDAGDFVVGVGWTTGSTSPIEFDGSFSCSSGTGLLTVYGWTTNPLVEYYIMEDYLNPPQQGTIKGTFTSDGATYTVWENQRVNEPSIQGTSTFNQYISIRNTTRTSGTVTVENHFKEWASLGMDLGTFNYQVMAIEGWSGSGSASQTVSNSGTAADTASSVTSSSTTSTTSKATSKATTSTTSKTATTTATSKTTTGTTSKTPCKVTTSTTSKATSSATSSAPSSSSTTGSSCSTLYGQCGGENWTGATCCSSGSCHVYNPWYSQCIEE